MTKRKQHKPEFKARVALEALKGLCQTNLICYHPLPGCRLPELHPVWSKPSNQ